MASEDVGDPLLAQHLHSLVVLQRLAIANTYGWVRFLHSVNQVLPKRGDTLELPLEFPEGPRKQGPHHKPAPFYPRAEMRDAG